MAASLKVSEMSALTTVAASDLFMIADVSATASKKVTLANMEASFSLANLGTRSINNLSDVNTSGVNTNDTLGYNGSAFVPVAQVTQASLHVDHLITLSGVAQASDHLGTFSGSTITDSSTIKTALQELETAVEGSVGGATTVNTIATSTNAYHYVTFVDSNNGSATAESLYTDGGIYYNPFTNQFVANGVNTGVLSINSVDVTSTAAELNILDGVTATAAELNILDGVTATAAELNILDGVTSTAAELNILDGVTATASELNILDGVTATASELNLVDGSTGGTVVASRAVVVDSDKDVTGFRNVTLTGELDAATLDISGNADIDGTANLDAVDIDGAVQADGTITVGTSSGGTTDYTTATGNAVSSTFDGTYTRNTGFNLDTGSPAGSNAQFHADAEYAYYVKSDDNSKMLIYSQETLGGRWVFVHKSGSDFRSSQLSNNDALGSTTAVELTSLGDLTLTVNGVTLEYPLADNSVWTYGAAATGYDVVLYGETSGASLTWDASVDDLILAGDARVVVPAGNLVIGSTAVSSTAAELNVLDGVTAFVDEDNMASNSATSIPSQQSVKAYVDANETHIDNIMTLLGETKDDTNLGTFTGSTISDNITVRAALQDLETAVDNALGGGAAAASVNTVTRSTDASHFVTFVTDDNGSATQENIFTDAGLAYNPSSNLLTVGALTVSGNLTVEGTTTSISSTTITVDDKNLELGSVDTPSDTTADGGGITLKGATDKTINWINSTDNWTSSESFDLVSGKEYKIANTSVLSATTLGSAVVNSSLTSVGTLGSLTVSGNINANGNIVGDNSTDISGINEVTATTFTGDLTGDVTGDVSGTAGIATKVNTITSSSSGTHYLTFVPDDNSSATAEFLYTDAGVLYQPNANTLIVNNLHVNTTSGLTIDSVNLTATATELNVLDGITSTTAELNILDGVTATAAELNILDGVTSTAAELNILDGVTATASELNVVDGTTAGTVVASKAVAVDANKDITGFRNITATGELDAATLDISGNADIDGTTNLDVVDIDGAVQIDATVTVGVDDTGFDVKFFGDTANAYVMWDASVDDFILAGAAGLIVPEGQLTIGSTAVTATAAEINTLDGITSTTAELNLLDGVTATTAELNILDGVTSTAAELNLLDGVTATTAEINYLDGVTSAIQTQLNAKTADGDNVNNLVGNTSADSEPTNYFFLVVDASDGSLKVINKTFVEDEGGN